MAREWWVTLAAQENETPEFPYSLLMLWGFHEYCEVPTLSFLSYWKAKKLQKSALRKKKANTLLQSFHPVKAEKFWNWTKSAMVLEHVGAKSSDVVYH